MVSKREHGALVVILTVSGKRFYNNVDSEKDALMVVELLRKINKSTLFFIKNFNVGFDEDLPRGEIKKWRKKEGFSIWYTPIQKEVK